MSSGRRDDRISGNTDSARSLEGAISWALLGTLQSRERCAWFWRGVGWSTT